MEPEDDANPEIALAREIRQELGKTVLHPRLFCTTENRVDSKLWHAVYYICEVYEGGLTLEPEEVIEVAWVNRETVMEYDFEYGNGEVLERYFQARQ